VRACVCARYPVTDNPAADGNMGATWNYGASTTNDFGGGTPNAAHSGGVGMFGSYGYTDTGTCSPLDQKSVV
jgi:hypothetical protein